MFNTITYYMIGGLPLIVYTGFVTLFFIVFAAAVSYMNRKGFRKIGFKWHSRLAKIGIALAVIHGTMGLLSYI